MSERTELCMVQLNICFQYDQVKILIYLIDNLLILGTIS